MNQDKPLCSHSKLAKIKNDSLHTFCEKCGILVMNSDNTLMYLVKPLKYERNIDFDPLEHLNTIKEKIMISQNVLENGWYMNHRKKACGYLYKLIDDNHYSDAVFYTALSYLDSIMHNCDEISETKLDLIVISCFLLAVKFADNDPYVPDLSNIPASNCKFLYSLRDVRKYEEHCLKLLEYKLDCYTPYDMLLLLLNNGIIFEQELVDKSEEMLTYAYTLATQLLAAISMTSVFLQHNQIQIAFAVVYIARRHFHLDKALRKKLTKLYQIPFKYFSQCVKDIKQFCVENSSRIQLMQKTPKHSTEIPDLKIITPKARYNTSVNLTELGIRKSPQDSKADTEHDMLSENTLSLNTIDTNNTKPKCQITIPNSLCSSISTAHNSVHGSGTKIIENRKVFLPQSSKEIKFAAFKRSFEDVNTASIKNKISDKECVNKLSQLKACSVLPCINEKSNNH